MIGPAGGFLARLLAAIIGKTASVASEQVRRIGLSEEQKKEEERLRLEKEKREEPLNNLMGCGCLLVVLIVIVFIYMFIHAINHQGNAF